MRNNICINEQKENNLHGDERSPRKKLMKSSPPITSLKFHVLEAGPIHSFLFVGSYSKLTRPNKSLTNR